MKYVYIDDPISSLDENNAIAVASHLGAACCKDAPNESSKVVISTHHALFFNVLCNELKKQRARRLPQDELKRRAGIFTLQDTDRHAVLPSCRSLAELHEAQKSGELYTIISICCAGSWRRRPSSSASRMARLHQA